MKYTDLENILTNTFGNNGLEFLLMDCCWAMILENIHQFKDLTKNFIASEDEMPALGIGYTHFTEFITQKPDIKPYELAKMMVAVYYTKRFDDYNDPSDPSFKNMGVSLTCVDTKAYKNFVLDPFIKLVSTLTNNMRLYAKDIFKSLSCCKDFTYVKSKYTYAMFNLDIIWFFENLAYFTNDEKLKNSIYETILNIRLYLIKGYMENNYKETKLGGLFNGGKGIAVTLPKTERYYNYSTMGDPDFDIPFFKETKWREMVLRFYEYNFKTEIFLTAAIKNMDNPELISLINDSPFESGSFYNDLSLAVNAIQSNNKTDHSLESFTNLQKQIDYIDTEKFFSVFTPEFTKSLEPPQALLEGLNLNIREKWKKL